MTTKKAISWGVPNSLTLARVLCIPFFCVLFVLPFPYHKLCATVVFTLACITDWLDGFLARKWNQSTAFGAFLDPVADKLMVAVALILLVGERHDGLITWPALVIVGREITVSALREWLAEAVEGMRLPVTRIAQWKTAFQMASIITLLCAASHVLSSTWMQILYEIGVYGLWVSAGLTLLSMYQYLKKVWPRFE